MTRLKLSFWIGVAALVGLLYLGWSVVWPVAVALWGYDNLRMASLLFGVFYLAQVFDIVHELIKRWYEMQIAAIKKARPIMADPEEENGPGRMNICIEDCLAMVPEAARPQVIKAWILLGTEYAAREMGKAATTDFLHAMRVHVVTADPNPPWRE